MPYPSDQYPPGSDAGEVAGVDLALTDGDLALILSEYFDPCYPDFDTRAMLPHVLDGLRRAVPQLTDPGREYFAVALDLLEDVAASDSSPEDGARP